MPDTRRHRGRHPEDSELFAEPALAVIRTAVSELSWLLSRGYSEASALALVGDRYQLRSRQRKAVLRASCRDDAVEARQESQVGQGELAGSHLSIDGFNCIITIEAALAGALVMRGRDGATRDIASVHGSYRRVEETEQALDLIADLLSTAGLASTIWYLDRPVSNSGRLRALIEERARSKAVDWTVELVNNPDRTLVERGDRVVASSDGWVLDRAGAWIDLPGLVIAELIPEAWLVDLAPA